MNLKVSPPLRLSETWWRGIILALSGAVILFTIWCLTHGITTIFMHLYYFPIVLLAYRYRWKGFGLATLLALAYLGLVLVFDTNQPDVILGAFYRFLVFVGIAAVIAYLSEHLVQAQMTAQQSAELRERYLSLAPAIILVLDRNGTITYLNEKGCAILACSFEKVEGKPWVDTFIKESERDQVRSIFNNLIGGNLAPYSRVEGEVIAGTGTVRFIRWYNTLIRDAEGMITSTMSYGDDITEEKQAQDSLRKMQQFQESVIANANVWISVLSPDGTLLVWNDAAEAISGYKKSEVVGKKTVWKHLYPDNEYRRKVTKEIQRIISRDTFLENFETEIRCADGTTKTIVWNTRGLRDTDGTIAGYIAIGRDISAQKAAEFRAGESSHFLATMIDTLPMPIFFKDVSGRYLGCNPPFEEYIGIRQDHLIGKTAYDISPKNLADRYTAADRQVFDNPVSQRYETQIRYADGSRHDVIFSKAPFFNKDGSVGGLIGAFLDITERKRSEEEIRLSNVILKTQQETSPDCILIVDESGKILSFNQRFAEIWGIPQEIVDSRSDERALSFVLDKLADPQEFLARVRNLYEHWEEKSWEEILLKDGTVLERYSAPMLGEDNRYFGRVWYFHDITERKRAEAALRNSQQILEGILNTIPVRVFWKDKELTFMGCNTPFAHDAGFEKPEDIIGKDDYSMGWRDQAELYRADDRAVIESGRSKLMIEEPQTTPAGETIYILTNKVPLLDAKGDAIGVLGTYLDITERKQMETALRESRQLFADIISFLPDPTFVIDKNGKVLAWNRAIEQLSGVPADNILGKGDHEYSLWVYGKRRPLLVDLVLHPDQDNTRLDYTAIQRDGQTVTGQRHVVLPDGRKIFLSFVASSLFDAQGNVVGAIESIRDITHLKEAEAELARINQNLEKIIWERTRALEDEVAQRMHAEKNVQDALSYTRSVIEANPDLMVVLDRNGTVLDVNAAGESLTGIPREQLIGTPYFGYLVDDGAHTDAFSRILKAGRIKNSIQLRRTDGHVTPLSMDATVIGGKDAPDTRILVSAHDITRQKQDEEAIRASLDEKVLLLREVHHRVKNNLQIIISLTNLQMRQTDDPGVKQIMTETQNRVRAMSLVHEKLYQSESLSRIDFADYTRFLATQLFSYFGTDTQRVQLDLAMGTIMVDINTAVPLGLLMNELVSNALKHAFPHGREGTISISGGDEGDLITLVVRDNGIGIPAEFDWKTTTSLGMRLITILVDQVDGTITLDRNQGTSFTITVRRKPAIGGKE
jgi:PAS domain S-box-containing protein